MTEPAGSPTSGKALAEGRQGTLGTLFGNLSFARKVALVPALTLLLMGLMLAVAMRMGERNTVALRGLDRDVFEPLNRAQTLKDGITLLHTRLFALLSLGTNQSDPEAQKANAEVLIASLDEEVAKVNGFLDTSNAVLPPIATRVHDDFGAYATQVRQAAEFASYDASYGALLAGGADEEFGHLRADLDDLVQALEQRRSTLANEAVGGSINARQLLLGLGVGAVVIVLLGSVVVGRDIARPVLGLTALMNRLAGGDTELAVPGIGRHDEVGAMARAVEVFRDDAIARRLSDLALRRTNQEFDVALNSMVQGMVVWSAEHRVQLINQRFFAICGMPWDTIAVGMTVPELVDCYRRNGLYPGLDPVRLGAGITRMLTERQSDQAEVAMRPGLFVRITRVPIPGGGAVVTFDDVTDQRRKDDEITFIARHDALTGLPNRRTFQEHMTAASARLCEGQQFAVLCIDLDRFKEVNDTLGHAAGDELLRLVAARLRRCARQDDMIARLGGDEFAIVLTSEGDSLAPASGLAARLVEAISAPYDIEGHHIVIGTSVGVAMSEPGVSGAELLKRADVALYRAKQERGTFVFHEPGMDEQLLASREMEADLRLAVQRGEFELYYQPIYDLVADRVSCFEALIRWNSPTRGAVLPGDFIPLAERTGLIVPIGEWVLRAACAQAAAWPDRVRVAVNLSSVQFKNKRLVELVSETLEQTGLGAHRLELEITESVLLWDTDQVMTMLHRLHDLKVRVAMDDFGTGFSSLSYLHRFPFDKIKIDRSFVSDLSGTPLDEIAMGETISPAAESAAVIVRAMIGLGTNLGITTTAEGVETAAQLEQIRRTGCVEAQGYFISPPRPAAEVLMLLQRLDATMPAITGGWRTQPRLVA